MAKLVKSVTLTPGRWVYVCPCGFQTIAGPVYKTTNKYACYCFKCKQQTGKYYRVMDERIDFDFNPNGKLNCQCFMILRLHNPIKWALGAIKLIYLKGIFKGSAMVVENCTIPYDRISRFIAKLDCAGLAEDSRRMLKELYKDRPGIDMEKQEIDLVVLEYMKGSKEPELFKL